MKKKQLIAALVLAMALCGAPSLFAADAEAGVAAEETDAIVPDMNFTGKPISLSLKDALKRITTAGPGYERAVLVKEAFEAPVKGREESWNQFRSVSDALNAAAAMPGAPAMTIHPMPTQNASFVALARPYLEEQAAIGYEIDLNRLVYNMTRDYHRVLQAQKTLAIAKENLRTQEQILEKVKQRFDLGIVPEGEMLSAESAVRDAVIKFNAATSEYQTVKMSFNIALDLPPVQEVVLTDTLHKAEAPEIDLKASVAAALANRNELRQLAFVLEKENIEFADLALSSRSSPEYLAAVEHKIAEKNLKDAKAYIELEIRTKYMNLQNLSNEIALIETVVANAREGHRLAAFSYDAGMNTLADVQDSQRTSYQAQLGLTAKIVEYNLAVSDFAIATGYGMGGAR